METEDRMEFEISPIRPYIIKMLNVIKKMGESNSNIKILTQNVINTLDDDNLFIGSWIPSKIQLPKADDDDIKPTVLCCDEHGNINVGFYSRFDETWKFNGNVYMGEVVAWMPRPDAYVPNKRDEELYQQLINK